MIRSDAQREIRFNPAWQLTVVPDETVRAAHFAPQTLAQVQAGGYLTVPAAVPGNFELDLERAGILFTRNRSRIGREITLMLITPSDQVPNVEGGGDDA